MTDAKETKTRPLLSEPDNSLADTVAVICGVGIAAELLVMLCLFLGLYDPALPPGPIAEAMAARAARVEVYKWYLVADTGLIVLTLALLTMAKILCAVNRTAHYLSQRLSR